MCNIVNVWRQIISKDKKRELMLNYICGHRIRLLSIYVFPKPYNKLILLKKPNIYNDSHFLRPNKQIVKEGKYKFHIFNDKTNYTNNTYLYSHCLHMKTF